MPHATIETNRTCNIRCDNCYNTGKDHVKDYFSIVNEIDALINRRALQTLTIIGGEPTLHPDLVRIVCYIKSKKLKCQILTNGFLFIHPTGDALLDSLHRAAVDRIAVHIDNGQRHIYNDIEQTRRIIFEKLETRKIHFSLSLTIDTLDRGTVPRLAKTYANYRYFDGIVGFMASGNPEHKNPAFTLEEEYKSISKGLSLEPSAYLPSNLDLNEIRWLIFYYMINTRTLSATAISPFINRLFCSVYGLFIGRFPFNVTFSPQLAGIVSVLISLWEAIASPRKAFDHLRWIPWTSLFSSVRFHYIALQVPPEFDASTPAIEICRFCPDATMRNGYLMPLCLADAISPLEINRETPPASDDRFSSVLHYLNGPEK